MFLRTFYLKQIGFAETTGENTDYWHEDIYEWVAEIFKNDTGYDMTIHITIAETIDFLNSVRWTIMSSIKELEGVWLERDSEYNAWLENQENNPIWELREEEIRY